MKPTVVGLVFGASFMWSLEELQFLVFEFSDSESAPQVKSKGAVQ